MRSKKFCFVLGNAFGDVVSGGPLLVPQTADEKRDSMTEDKEKEGSTDTGDEDVDKPCSGCPNCNDELTESSDDNSDSEPPFKQNDKVIKSQRQSKKNSPNCKVNETKSQSTVKNDGNPPIRAVNRKTVFFERQGTTLMQNFFELTKKSKKSGNVSNFCSR